MSSGAPRPGPTWPSPGRSALVTVDDFAAFVSSTAYETTAEKAGYSRIWTPDGYSKAPLTWRDSTALPWNGGGFVLHVSWLDAQAYCAWSGSRLPTSDRWMKLFEWGPLEAFPLLGVTHELTSSPYVDPRNDGIERWATKGGGKLALPRDEILRWSGHVRSHFSSDTVTCRVEIPTDRE